MDKEKLQQIVDLYEYYHKKTWIYKHDYKRNKRINLAINLTSACLASVGVITGGILLNPILLGVLTSAGILLKTFHEIKNYKGKIELLKFGVTTYEKVLNNLRTAMRGGQFDYQKFISEMKLLDEEIIVLSSQSSKFVKKYNKKFKKE